MKPPRHRYEVTIKVGANSESDLWNKVNTLEQMSYKGLQSFVSSCGIIDVTINEDQTEENYRRELEKYLEFRKHLKEENDLYR